MKKLFKSALKTILKSKVGLILLGAIVFLTAGTFTLFNSTTNSFSKSYDYVMKNGNLHDFTVKELYSLSGDFKLEPEKGPVEYTQRIDDSEKIVNIDGKDRQIIWTDRAGGIIGELGEKFLIVPTSQLTTIEIEEKVVLINDTILNLEAEGYFAISLDDIYQIDTDNDGIADNIKSINQNGDLDIYFMTYLDTELSLQKTRLFPITKIGEDYIDDLWANNLGWRQQTISEASNGVSTKIIDTANFTISNYDSMLKEIYDFGNKNDVFIARNERAVYLNVAEASGSYIVYDGVSKEEMIPTYKLANINYPLRFEESKFQDDKGEEVDLNTLPGITPLIESAKDIIDGILLKDLSKSFVKTIDDLYGENGSEGYMIDVQRVKSLQVNSQSGNRKIVSAIDSNRIIDRVVKFEGYDMPLEMSIDNVFYDLPMTKDTMEEYIWNVFRNNYNNDNVAENSVNITNKGYKVSISWDELEEVPFVGFLGATDFQEIPRNESIMDPSSFLAYVSPSYASENNVKFVDPNEIIALYDKAIQESDDSIEYMTQQFTENYKDSIVWVDQTPYIAIGSGTTPDFSYPIIGPDVPVPNVKEEAILFTNQSGYERIFDAWRGNPREEYLAYTFTNKASGMEDEIINVIESKAKEAMSWGNNVDHIVSKTFDTSETFILAPHRVAFLNKLNNNVSLLSTILTIALIIFAAVVVILVIKKQINSSKKNLGILMANGYSKFQIALSNIVIAFLAIVIPCALGYIVGHFMQYILINQFSNVWTLPIVGSIFSWIDMFAAIEFPLIAVAALVFIISLWEMRGPLTAILSGKSSKTAGRLTSIILSPLRFVGIKTKASMSLFFTNISKMILVLVSSAMAVITIAVSISTMDKFDRAKVASTNATSYANDIRFAAPTKEGGLLKSIKIDQIGLTDEQIQDGKTIYDFTYDEILKDRTKAQQDHSTIMYPMQEDANWQNDVNYLDNLIQTKTLLNLFMGSEGIGANPWDLAKKLMPENQLSLANSKDVKFINYTLEKWLESGKSQPSFLRVSVDEDGNEKEDIETGKKIYESDPSKMTILGKIDVSNPANTEIFLKDEVKEFFWFGYLAAVSDYKETGSLENFPFLISYRNMIIGDKDETYTNMEGYTNHIDYRKNTDDHKFDIKGIKSDTNYINLSDSSIKNLEENEPKMVNGKLQIPIVVNEYFKEFYQVKVGDAISYKLTNGAERFSLGTNGTKDESIILKIVGTQNSYNNQRVYTLQEYAREAMGWDRDDNMFNAVFTGEEQSEANGKYAVMFNTLTLYSVSGIYPGADAIPIESTHPINVALQEKISSDPMWNTIENVAQYFGTYTNNAYVTFSGVNSTGADEFIFDTTSDLSRLIIMFIEGITIFLSTLFIIIISVMMIEDNKKFIATLKVMGYRGREITTMFFGSFIPSLLAGLFIAAPIAFGMAELIRFLIMSFGSILIPVSLTWWTVLLAFGITVIGAGLTYWLSTRGLKNTKMLQAFSQ